MSPAEAPDTSLLRARRDRASRSWDVRAGTVLIPSGAPLPIDGTDQVHDYHAHPEHAYLSGSREPSSVLAFDPVEGWVLFAPASTLEERVWTNAAPSRERLQVETGVEDIRTIEALVPWLELRRGNAVAVLGNADFIDHPERYRLPDLRALELSVDEGETERLRQLVSEQRRAKDPPELARMRAAASASVAGHLSGIGLARAGMSERQYQIEIESEFFRNGGSRTAYGSIVGGGPNGAVLHFSPTSRQFRDGDIVLVDAAAEVGGYASDVTRTFPIGPRFEGLQADLYDLVLATQQRAIEAAGPGVEYKDLHMAAAEQIAGGLADLGILRGTPSDLVDADAHALFFPHGLGHMIGLSTHDAGGCLAGRQPSDRFGLKYLRADLPLAPGYVVTIEPGIYFIDALLTDSGRRDRYRDMVDWDRVDKLRGFGGIRIEDDILITETGTENLSGDLPSERSAIESLRAQALANG